MLLGDDLSRVAVMGDAKEGSIPGPCARILYWGAFFAERACGCWTEMSLGIGCRSMKVENNAPVLIPLPRAYITQRLPELAMS